MENAGNDLRSMADRRQFKRFQPRICEVNVRPKVSRFLRFFRSAPSRSVLAVLDLAEGGARVVVRGHLEAGTKVAVRLQVRVFNDSLDTEGTVLWCNAHPHRIGWYVIGLRFVPLSALEARKIASLRQYLGSPEFRQKEQTRHRLRPIYTEGAIEYES